MPSLLSCVRTLRRVRLRCDASGLSLHSFPDWSVGRVGDYNCSEPSVNPKAVLDTVCGRKLASSSSRPVGRFWCPTGTTRRGETVAVEAHERTGLVELFSRMFLIRAFEQRVSSLYRGSEIPGFIHPSLGQEAVAVGVCAALRDDDWIATRHRGHGHCLAKGADLNAAMAELFGKATGLCKGKGGSMHIADPRKGILGATAIAGGSLPLATGAALSSRLLGRDGVSVAFFGEGAVNQGTFHESVNLAAIWNLPVLFVCENNRYAEFTDSNTMSRSRTASTRLEPQRRTPPTPAAQATARGCSKPRRTAGRAITRETRSPT